MRNTIRYIIILTFFISGEAHAQKYVYPEAVITVKQNTIVASTVGAYGIEQSSLGDNTLVIKDRRSSSSSPQFYNRKNNLCKSVKVRKMLKNLRGARCEPNYAYFASGVPNDSLFSFQYSASLTSLTSSWDRTTGRADLIAVIVDTGISYNHPDLIDNIWSNPGEIPNNNKDDDNNGVVDDVHGYNAINNSGDPLDDNGHGTHVAGIIGARGNNRIGIAGVSWNVKLVASKFLNKSGVGSLSNAIKAIDYGTKLRLAGYKVVVSNNSWGSLSNSAALASAIKRAQEAGILFVAAAGNSSKNSDVSPMYPAAYNIANVISVASVGKDGTLSSFSNYGPKSVHITAPGSNVMSTYTANYKSMSGTSMAAPHVSGAAVAIQSVCSNLIPFEKVKDIILNNGTYSAALYGKVMTSFILNVDRSTQAASNECAFATPSPETTQTPIPTKAATATPIITQTQTPTPTRTSTPIPTNTQTPTPTPTPTATATPSPSSSPTPPYLTSAYFSSVVKTSNSGVRAASIYWVASDTNQILLKQSTNYEGKVQTEVSGDEFQKNILNRMGKTVRAVVLLPGGYTPSVYVSPALELKQNNEISVAVSGQ